MKYIKQLLLIMLFFSTASSCRKFIEPAPPVDKINSGLVFTEPETATSAVVGIYSKMMSTALYIGSGAVTIYTGLSSDELYNTNMTSANLSELRNNAISPGNGLVSYNFWNQGYSIIYQANACIEGLSNNKELPAPVKNQLLGEAYFGRAFIYYYLVGLFGDIPLITGTDYQENQQVARTAASTVYDQVVTDLTNAQSLLDVNYPTTERVRPNKWTATALLARVYLTLGQWELAEQEATSIINSGDYSLEPDLTNVFLASSSEAIWRIMPVVDGFNTTEGRTFVPSKYSSGPPSFVLTSYLFSSFEANDLRKNSWIASKVVQEQVYHYPYKYKVGDYGMPVTEYYVAFRLAEQYLIRAEALARQGKPEAAKSDLDVIRIRAGLGNTPATTTDELLTAIAHERQIELFAEWGARWFDLKRTKKADEVLSIIKPGWQSTDTLYPIPLLEIQRNPLLVQNPGY